MQSVWLPVSSKKHTETAEAFSEKREKLVPMEAGVAPSG